MLWNAIYGLMRRIGMKPTRGAIRKAVEDFNAKRVANRAADAFGDPPSPPMHADGSIDYDVTCVDSGERQIYVWYYTYYAWEAWSMSNGQTLDLLAVYQSEKSRYSSCRAFPV